MWWLIGPRCEIRHNRSARHALSRAGRRCAPNPIAPRAIRSRNTVVSPLPTNAQDSTGGLHQVT